MVLKDRQMSYCIKQKLHSLNPTLQFVLMGAQKECHEQYIANQTLRSKVTKQQRSAGNFATRMLIATPLWDMCVCGQHDKKKSLKSPETNSRAEHMHKSLDKVTINYSIHSKCKKFGKNLSKQGANIKKHFRITHQSWKKIGKCEYREPPSKMYLINFILAGRYTTINHILSNLHELFLNMFNYVITRLVRQELTDHVTEKKKEREGMTGWKR